MMNIKEKLTCKCCNEIYNNPVTLACGDTVCRHHIEEQISSYSLSRTFLCPLCNRENLNQNLDVNKVIQSLLEIELHEYQINPVYKTVLKNLNKEIENLESILKDPENCIFEEIGELKRQVDLDRERLKTDIDSFANDFINRLESHEARFKNEYKANVDLEHYKALVESSKKQLAEYEQSLSMFSTKKEERYAKRIESEKIIDKLQPEIKELKDKLISNLSINYKPVEIKIEDFFGSLTISVSKSKNKYRSVLDPFFLVLF